MKKQFIIHLILLVEVLGISAQSNTDNMYNYNQQWKNIEKLSEKDLAKSAIEEIDKLWKHAVAENNTQQIIKAILFTSQYKININSDENTQIFSELENLLNETADIADKSLLNSVLAELYLNYYLSFQAEINQRSLLTDYIPDDIKEWSKNIFFEKITGNLIKATENQSELLTKTTNDYKEIILFGKDSDEFYPTLFDFLMKRNIELSRKFTYQNFENAIVENNIQLKSLSTTEEFINMNLGKSEYKNGLLPLIFYQQYLKSITERNMLTTRVLTELDRNDFLQTLSNKYKNEFFLDVLYNFENEYREKPISVFIIEKIAEYYQSNNRAYSGTDTENNESMTQAYQWLRKGIEKFPDYQYTQRLRYKLSEMEKPFAEINGNAIFYPEKKDKKLILRYKNLKQIKISVYEANSTKENGKLINELVADLTTSDTYLYHEKQIDLGLDKTGNYRLSFDYDIETNNNPDSYIYITELMTFSRAKSPQEFEFYIVNRQNGEPVSNASIVIEKDSLPIATVNTDTYGFALYKSSENLHNDYSLRSQYSYKVYAGKDRPGIRFELPFQYSFRNDRKYITNNNGRETTSIFTDRSIYRPGQTLYYKVVSSQTQNGKHTAPSVDKELKIELFDTNNQFVSSQKQKTNEFGSASGEFILPSGGITGSYFLRVADETLYIQVEEYKRPTFQIEFDRIDKTYSSGEKVIITGNAANFSGIKLQDAKLNYTITERSLYPWRRNSKIIKSGETATTTDGSFNIEFTIPENTDQSAYPWRNIFIYDIYATITDINGETQSGNYSLTAGSVSMILNTNIPDKLEKNSLTEIEIKAANLSGVEITTQGEYTVRKIEITGKDTIVTQSLKGTFKSGQQPELAEKIKKLESGQYIIKLSANDSNGKAVESEKTFVLYSLKDKRPPVFTNEWIIDDNNMFTESKQAEIILGISSSNITVLYELMKNEQLYERRQIQYNNENKTFVIPYKKEYGSQVYAVFTYAIDENVYKKYIAINKKEEKKELTLKLETFRDKIRPGSNEEWKISVKNSSGKAVLSEVLASMYDSSLDKLYGYRPWTFNQLYSSGSFPFSFESPYTRNIYSPFYFNTTIGKYPALVFDRLYLFGFSFFPRQNMNFSTVINDPYNEPIIIEESQSDYYTRGLMNQAVSFKSVASESPAPIADALQGRVQDMDFNPQSSTVAETLKENAVGTYVLTDEKEIPVQIRRNFNETAFFYPHLRTGENGETIISFTVPESNTVWKFRAIAHDKAMNTGTLESFTVSRKELMVTPNIPRFMRQGDKTTISTKISNLSEDTISGKVSIEFFDPYTEKPVTIDMNNQKQSFSLAKDASGTAEWTFTVPADIEDLGCRIVARNESFSDGEQHAIPVLPNRMLVTETMPVYVNGNSTKNFTFENIANQSQTLSNYRLTFEYSSNPAWYAIQALPSLSNPTNENVVNWFASYYTNTLAYAIGVQYPKVTAMINAWKNQGGNKQSFVSDLQKNEELKTVLLEETPWVLDAKTETEQMERLSLLFDLNNTNQKTNTAIAKLAELQNNDGGWSWMKGFASRRSITQYILFGFAELVELGAAAPNEAKEMQIKAIHYIDKLILDDYQNLQKNNTKWQQEKTLSTNQLEYLYVRSYYRDIPIMVETREAERFYTTIAENNWTNLDLYQRSLLAVVLYKNGNKKVAEDIINSLRERATINDEMGMYWANNKSNVFVSLSAVSTHVFLMNAFKETGAGEVEMDKMKQWLINQKRTQAWESTHATIDAVYAILSTGNDLFTDSQKINIKVGPEYIQAEQARTGYFKQVWERQDITGDMANVEITQTGIGISYGALYWQYYEDMDKITRQTGAFAIDKKLFVETSSGFDKGIIRETENNPLKVGDKVIVRLTIKTDRDMDFVHLKDMRASCFEPVETLSGNKWQNGLVYYRSIKDASVNFFFDHLPKGTYVFEYPLYVSRTGEYSNGITTIQCMYAPEFISNTEGGTVKVE